MTNGIFITATGTDVGKTYVSGLILKKLRNLGVNAGYYKPALSGAVYSDGKLIPGDCDFVLKQAGIGEPPENFVSYVFEQAVSPHLASVINNVPIELSKIVNDFNSIKSRFEFVLVEGAGGIVCPFNLGEKRVMLTDVIKALGLDIIIVASASLGTINSTVLTVEYARALGINVRGIILNNYDESDLMQKDNLIQIKNLTGVDVIATVKSGQQDIDMSIDIFKEV